MKESTCLKNNSEASSLLRYRYLYRKPGLRRVELTQQWSETCEEHQMYKWTGQCSLSLGTVVLSVPSTLVLFVVL